MKMIVYLNDTNNIDLYKQYRFWIYKNKILETNQNVANNNDINKWLNLYTKMK